MAKNLVLGQILVQMRAAIFYFFIFFQKSGFVVSYHNV